MQTPSRQLMRRHAAAMAIIDDLAPEERGLRLLAMVLLGSPEIDAAVEAAELAGKPIPSAGRRTRRNVTVNA